MVHSLYIVKNMFASKHKKNTNVRSTQNHNQIKQIRQINTNTTDESAIVPPTKLSLIVLQQPKPHAQAFLCCIPETHSRAAWAEQQLSLDCGQLRQHVRTPLLLTRLRPIQLIKKQTTKHHSIVGPAQLLHKESII